MEAASAYKAVAQTYTESEKCSLSEIHVLRLAVTTVTVERNSPYKELVKRRWVFNLQTEKKAGRIDGRKKTLNNQSLHFQTSLSTWKWIDESIEASMVSKETDLWRGCAWLYDRWLARSEASAVSFAHWKRAIDALDVGWNLYAQSSCLEQCKQSAAALGQIAYQI